MSNTFLKNVKVRSLPDRILYGSIKIKNLGAEYETKESIQLEIDGILKNNFNNYEF